MSELGLFRGPPLEGYEVMSAQSRVIITQIPLGENSQCGPGEVKLVCSVIEPIAG